eukprot:scaffold191_cov677-Pavlova_lutheri.AAC.6
MERRRIELSFPVVLLLGPDIATSWTSHGEALFGSIPGHIKGFGTLVGHALQDVDGGIPLYLDEIAFRFIAGIALVDGYKCIPCTSSSHTFHKREPLV